jgi:hypothetical protein
MAKKKTKEKPAPTQKELFNQRVRENIAEINEELLIADGFDDAIIGVSEDGNHVVYDSGKMVGILVERDGMTYEEAREFLEFNTFCAYVGEHTPQYVDRSVVEMANED